jgi:hypothetical protein
MRLRVILFEMPMLWEKVLSEPSFFGTDLFPQKWISTEATEAE